MKLATKTKMLEVLRTDGVGDCRKCGLCETRQNIVFGRGDANAPLMFIGEGPGEEEDKQGLPFVGKAGEVLDKMTEAMGWPSEMIYVANIVKCRPPDNRDPKPEEREACFPYLHHQISIIRPDVIVTLGNVATRALLGQSMAGITTIRGVWMKYEGIAVMPTLHPAFVLHQPTGKRYLWQDAKAVVSHLKKMGHPPPRPAL